MKRKILNISLLSALILPIYAVAGENVSVGAQAGIFGIGANAKYKINDQVGVRAGFDMISIDDYEVEDDEVKYNFDLKLQDFMVVGDYHPWKGSFKTTAGVIVNSSSLDGEITPAQSQEFEFQGHTYSTNDIAKINTKVDFDPVAPYFGIGWDTSFDKDKGFGFTFDIGVIYQGAAEVDYSVHYKELTKTGNATVDQAAEAARETLIQNINKDLEEEKVSLQEELDKYEWLPYISIGVNYKF
jgi:hypothetical protein